MLIKEYRIPLPLSVEEYKIAQLYMIAVSGSMTLPLPRSLTLTFPLTPFLPPVTCFFPFRKKAKRKAKARTVACKFSKMSRTLKDRVAQVSTPTRSIMWDDTCQVGYWTAIAVSGTYFNPFSLITAWLKPLLPKSALTVEEMAWNAYPYTKTRYTCPLVSKFSIEIETKYFDDPGNQANVFNCADVNRQIGIALPVSDKMSVTLYV